MFTAVVPIRAGSEGLKGKNTRLLAGKPLYMHAVDQALAAGATGVVISTDIPDVLSGTHKEGVSVEPRPALLAGSAVPMAPVLAQILAARPDITGPIILLQATSPLRLPSDICAALALFAEGRFELVMSVTPTDPGVLKYGTAEGDRFVPLRAAAYCFTNRQALPPVYKPNGAVYVFDADWYRSNRSLETDAIGMHPMPEDRSHDIDTAADFERAEHLLAQREKSHKV